MTDVSVITRIECKRFLKEVKSIFSDRIRQRITSDKFGSTKLLLYIRNVRIEKEESERKSESALYFYTRPPCRH